MDASFELEGLSDLEATMMDFKSAINVRIARKALIAAGEPIADDAAERAPVLHGDLANNIEVGTKLSRRQAARHEKVSPVEVFVGPNSKVSQEAVQQEFGNEHHGPQAFMRPAWDAGKQDAMFDVKDTLTEEVGKAVERAARRQAKLIRQAQGGR